MTLEIDGRLEDKQGNPVKAEGCRIEAFFDQRYWHETAPAGGAEEASPAPRRSGPGRAPAPTVPDFIVAPQRVVSRSDAAGRFRLAFPDKEAIASDSVQVIVSSPSGRTIGRVAVRTEKLADDLRLPVTPEESIELDPEAAPPAPAIRRIQGRVIDLAGAASTAGLNLVVYGVRKDGGEASAEAALFTAVTDGSGYFFGECAREKLARAHAVIAGVPAPVEVTLYEDEIPDRVIVVVEFPADAPPAATKDASPVPRAPSQDDVVNSDAYSVDLGTGRCVQFNVPNRAIEEFDYYTVVRTTEPEIRGTTYGNDPGTAKTIGANNTYLNILLGDRVRRPRRTGGAAGSAAPSDARPSAFLERLERAGDTPAAVGDVLRSAIRGDFGELTEADKVDLVRWQALKEVDRVAAEGARAPGRAPLDAANPIDWDSTPTFYEAATIAHGHILGFKQVWYADGYSLGDLLYSLPLAPGQKKLISVVDWERREESERDEDTLASESLYSSLSRNRDVKEVVSGTLSESVRGGSKAKTSGIAAGLGGAANGSYYGVNYGALTGVSGGYGGGNSRAWQKAARNFSSKSLQQLRDRTLQSASAVRGLRSTVVHTAGQGESVRASTEVVANHNHCHAITVQYFEVLRHLKVVQELVDVQQCLFVPLPMSAFDRPKTLRWRQPLELYLQEPALGAAFDAAQRVETGWSEVDYPAQTYADELVTSVRGELELTLVTPLPPFEVPADARGDPQKTALALADSIRFLGGMLAVGGGGSVLGVGATATAAAAQSAAVLAALIAKEPTAAEKHAKFEREVMPDVAVNFANKLELHARVGNTERFLKDVDFTLVGDYRAGARMLVSFRGRVLVPIKRADIGSVVIKAGHGLPDDCRALVNSVSMRYRTHSFEHSLVSDPRVNDDLDMPRISIAFTPPYKVDVTKVSAGAGAYLETPTDAWEQRNPRKEDERLANSLLRHLNSNLEYYHHAIWWAMDPNRRYMLLDGFIAPGSGERSVASVVENRLVGIAGNCLVMPVARGVHLDPRFKPESEEGFVDLLDFYAPEVPVPAARVSLPTRGVFAEAVMGACNACEQIDETRFWRWEESPIDEPPALDAAAGTASRRSEPNAATPSAFPSPLVAIQNAPAAPEAAGIRAAADILGRQTFADVTGLAANQANAAAAYQQALSTALAFGKEASVLAQQAAMMKGVDKSMDTIDKTESAGKIDAEEAKGLRMSALRRLVGESGDGGGDTNSIQKGLELIAAAERSGAISKSVSQELSHGLLKGLAGDGGSPGAGAMSDIAKRFDPDGIQHFEMRDSAGTYGKIVRAALPADPQKGKRAPFPKTGMSGLADKEGNSSSFVEKLLEDSGEWIDAVGKAIAEWKDEPDAALSTAIQKALIEAGTKMADDATDKIPVARAIKLAAKFAIVFAEGVEKELIAANKALSKEYEEAYNADPDNSGYSWDDIQALKNVRSYQLNAVKALPGIIGGGVSATVEKGLKELGSWVVGQVAKKFTDSTQLLLVHLLKKAHVQTLVAAVLSVAGQSVPESRAALYRALLSAALRLYIRQLGDETSRELLAPLAKVGTKQPLDQEIVVALASFLVKSVAMDPHIKPLAQNLDKGTKAWICQRLNGLVRSLLASGVAVVKTDKATPSAEYDKVYIPENVLTAIQKGEEAAQEEEYERWREVGRSIDEVRKAMQSRLTLYSRVRQPELANLFKLERENPEEYAGYPPDKSPYSLAWHAYHAQVRENCERVSALYYQVGGGPDLMGSAVDDLEFEFVPGDEPSRMMKVSYELSGGELKIKSVGESEDEEEL